MKNKKVLNMVYAAVFAAMIFALTRFVQIPVPAAQATFILVTL